VPIRRRPRARLPPTSFRKSESDVAQGRRCCSCST
jgi:hypothetical protein